MENQSSISNEELFDLIPIDLVVNILSRLPIKSMAQCRCVAKLWSSIIRSPNHNMLFPNKSTNQPRFLLAFVVNGDLLFYSSPQTDKLESVTLSILTSHRHRISANESRKFCSIVRGLVCTQITGYGYTFALICNPVTGEYLTTPKVTMEETKANMYLMKKTKTEMYFGYDPVRKQFKVLCISWGVSGKEKNFSSIQRHVFTLDNTKKRWKRIQCQCRKPWYPNHDAGVCINGVLYFTAFTDQEKRVLVCFDVWSEKFGLIKIKTNTKRLVLVNYKDKLGAVDKYSTKLGRPFVLWVLEDVVERKWSKHIYEKPMYWPESYPKSLSPAGVTDNGEIMFFHRESVANPFNICFYNLESNNVIKVRVLGLPVSGRSAYHPILFKIFANFVEDLKLLM